ncbi:YiaA/YiaB family inner membrane protein [Boseongicola aestuarii]|uniref:YiaA/B two helix domain protein n=1 Tax=Boseongicola aestuarii TaxID=1470561 RepID=A0A238J015_9RHOB|nr:YiaA/YiaB family inner membrane protein [Boseongicola aestuarii]SMX23653.1 yiaA/B two helix domain protein [Boseongicola aestuarii]
MNAYINKPSVAWNYFTYGQFLLAGSLMAGGIYNLDASFAAKGFYAMAAIMLVSSTVSISKSLRDTEESARLHNKIEDAQTERLLAEASSTEIS